MDYCEEYEGPPELDHEVTLAAKVQIQWNNDDVIKQVVGKVAGMVYSDIKPQVSKAVLDGLDAQVNQALADMLSTEIQPTDGWGKPTGDKVSIRAMLQRDAEKWLSDNVDYQGRKGRESYGNQYPHIHWIVQEALNGKTDSRGATHLHKLVVDAAKRTIGDVTTIVEAEVKAQAKKALGL